MVLSHRHEMGQNVQQWHHQGLQFPSSPWCLSLCLALVVLLAAPMTLGCCYLKPTWALNLPPYDSACLSILAKAVRCDWV
jgi:hypothetical protein